MSDNVIRYLSEWLTVNGGMRYHFFVLRAGNKRYFQTRFILEETKSFEKWQDSSMI